MNRVEIAQKSPLVDNVVFLEGLSRAGKFFLGKIVSNFENTEYFQYVSDLENLTFLAKSNCISEDAVVALLQIDVDEHAYNMRIGRNLNYRCDDASSLVNSLESQRYLKRSTEKVDQDIAEQMRREGRNHIFVLHESLSGIKIYLKAFPRLKWIGLLRHPLDIAHSWYLKGWGHRFSSDPLAFIPVIKAGKSAVPWYTLGWEDEYLKMSEMDRIIKSIKVLCEKGEDAYASLTPSQKEQVLFVCYENVVENTNKEVERIGLFLDTVPLKGMSEVLARERCSGKISADDRLQKKQNIKDKASDKMFDLLMDISSLYDKRLKSR